MADEPVDEDRVDEMLEDLDDSWDGSTEQLERVIEFADFMTAVQFVDELAPVAEEHEHHPDLGISWRTVTVTLSTHSAGGVTELDFNLAKEVDRIADDLPKPEPDDD